MTDRQTDGQTDRQTDRQNSHHNTASALHAARLHYMQRGKKLTECRTQDPAEVTCDGILTAMFRNSDVLCVPHDIPIDFVVLSNFVLHE